MNRAKDLAAATIAYASKEAFSGEIRECQQQQKAISHADKDTSLPIVFYMV